MTFIFYLNTQESSQVEGKSNVSVNMLPGNQVSARSPGGILGYLPPHFLEVNRSQK